MGRDNGGKLDRAKSTDEKRITRLPKRKLIIVIYKRYTKQSSLVWNIGQAKKSAQKWKKRRGNKKKERKSASSRKGEIVNRVRHTNRWAYPHAVAATSLAAVIFNLRFFKPAHPLFRLEKKRV